MDSNFLEQIRKTDTRALYFGVIAFLALIGPVALEIHIVDPESYRILTVSKIVLLALGTALPVAVLNTLLCFAATNSNKAQTLLPGTPDLNASAGLAVTALLLYTDLALQYLFGYSLRVFIAVGGILELALIVWSVWQIRFAKEKANKIAASDRDSAGAAPGR